MLSCARSAAARSASALKRNELYLSPISIWELLILVEKGRVVLETDVDTWLDRAQRAAPLTELPVTNAIARESRAVELPHQDPADRFLAATARVMELQLVTADRRLIASKGVPTLPRV